MNISLEDQNLSVYEKKQIQALLSQQNKNITSDLEQMWYLMDLVWDMFNCDSENLCQKDIQRFYSHPVWLLNGLFIEQDKVSMGHRHAISNWVSENKIKKAIDYGGGFGTLAILISEKNPHIKIHILEPYPTNFALKRIRKYSNIKIINNLSEKYDCLLTTDVLEHLSDPLKELSLMISSLRIGGYLIIANAFYPMIKCHLPQVFHFRHTFDLFAKLMGLTIIGQLKGSHATIYMKNENKKINWTAIRRLEKISRYIFFARKNSGPLGIKSFKHLFFELFKQRLHFIKKLVLYENLKH